MSKQYKAPPKRGIPRILKVLLYLPLQFSASLRAYFCVLFGIKRKKVVEKKERIIVEE